MPPSLDEYFEESLDEAAYRFILSSITTSSSRADLVRALAEFMARNKTDPEVTKDLLDTAGWAAAVAALQMGRISVRRGDFAEMLAVEAAEAFNGMAVPVRKLRYQVDPNQTLPGSDVVALRLSEDGSIDDLNFIESKYRTNPPSNIAVMAHDQLAADRDDGYATTINFIAHRLHELDLDLYKAFIEFLADRNVKETTNTVVLCFDGENWDDQIANNLDGVPEHLPELWLRLFSVEEAIDLIDAVYDQLLWQAIDDD